MQSITFFKKIKNTFLTPSWINYYYEANNIIKENKSFNKYKNFFLKILWFFPNLESHKYWMGQKEKDQHGYQNYLKIDEDANLLITEIEKRVRDKKSRILDLCCNAGRHLNQLNQLGYSNLYGVDMNSYAIEKMKNIYKDFNSNNVSCSSAENYLLKTEDNFFDVVYTHGASVELIPSTFPIVNEVCRVTKNIVIFLIQEDGHSYPRFWKYEFKKNNMILEYFKKVKPSSIDKSGLSLLVYRKNNE